MFPPFCPQYLFPSELQSYDLPTATAQPNVIPLVQFASVMIDEACGRFDGDGSGSLVFTTYQERILMQTPNRNLVLLPYKPLAVITAAEVALLQAAATGNSVGASGNCFYTGVQPYTSQNFLGTPSAILAASGRYGYSRQDRSVAYPDLFSFINPLNLVTMFGGPAPFVAIDLTNTDYDSKTGEVWVPAGLQLQKYSEIIVTYNSGYDPFNMPPTIKLVCAAAVKNLFAKGAGTTGMQSIMISKAGANVQMNPAVIDPVLDRMLTPFKTIRAY